MTLQAALIDEPSRADPFDLFEDRSRAGMPVEPGMFAATPAQVLLENLVQLVLIAALELERRREHDVPAMMKHGIVVAEPDVRRVHELSFILFRQDLARL